MTKQILGLEDQLQFQQDLQTEVSFKEEGLSSNPHIVQLKLT